MEVWIINLAVAVFGLIIGSFLTVCIHRIPFGREEGPGEFGEEAGTEKEDALKADDQFSKLASEQALTILNPPRSFCPSCQKQLLWYHNIPFFSWLLLKGQCAYCGVSIGWLYPAVELLTAVFALLCFNLFPWPTALLIFAFCSSLIVISFIDIKYFIIPNCITFPAMAIGLVVALLNQFFHLFDKPVVSGLEEAFWGVVAGGGFLWAVAEAYYRLRKKEGLGLGDVKLMAATGIWFGWQSAFLAIFLGSLFGSVLGVLLLVLLRSRFSRPLPFGPYLAVGIVLYLFLGEEIITVLYGPSAIR